MNIQIFSAKKNFDCQKAERYFKERNIKFQLVDINIKGLSKGELKSIIGNVGIKNLINIDAKEYKTLNIDQIRSDEVKEEILLKNNKLYMTPIVRNGKLATVGYKPEVWDKWE